MKNRELSTTDWSSIGFLLEEERIGMLNDGIMKSYDSNTKERIVISTYKENRMNGICILFKKQD